MLGMKIASAGSVTMKGFPVMSGGDRPQVIACFASYAEAVAWVEWKEYRQKINAECNAVAQQAK